MGEVILPSSELPGRHHLQTRMRVDLVEVLERTRQLRQHRRRVTQVHTAHVVALEGVHEALGHAVALRATHGRVDRLQAQ